MKNKLEQYLGRFVYGAIDGTVTTFAVVAAATGAGLSPTVIIILGIANLVGDGFSMGASAYLAAKSDRDLRRKLLGIVSKLAKAGRVREPLKDGLATFAAFVVAGLVPLLAFVVDALLRLHLPSAQLFTLSTLLTGLVFITVGLLKAGVTKTSRLRAAAETLVLGGVAAGLAYVLGGLLGQALGVG